MTVSDMPKAPILFITGTDTGVGKTIATAACASILTQHIKNFSSTVCATATPTTATPVTSTTAGSATATSTPAPEHSLQRSFSTVAVYKPVQTGVIPAEAGDVQEVSRLSGATAVSEGARLRAPMAPVAAAQHEYASLPTCENHVSCIQALHSTHDYVLVEGAGGLLVKLDRHHTLADLAASFIKAAVIVVCRSGLGTLNHTELTLEALRNRELSLAGVIIGSWPQRPTSVDLSNREYLASLPEVPLLACIPEHASRLSPDMFRSRAPQWFSSEIYLSKTHLSFST